MRAVANSRWVLPGVLLLALGGSSLLTSGWMGFKAHVAQWLVARSWEQVVETGDAARPWPWADQRVFGRLRVPEMAVDLWVFDNDSGAALAFGPGFSNQGGRGGSRVISGHRDTHFAFLREIELGMSVELELAGQSRPQRYRVVAGQVMDSREGRLPQTKPDAVVLVTCFPFHALVPGGPLRYVVVAEPEVMALAGRVVL